MRQNMGHIFVCAPPPTQPWVALAELVDDDADVATLASATAGVAADGFERLCDDPGVAEAWWVFAQVPLAAQRDDFLAALREVGINASPGPTLFSLAVGVANAAVALFRTRVGYSDAAEMARLAAVETLASLLCPPSAPFEGPDPARLQAAARRLTERDGFAELNEAYFGRFCYRFLAYHLDGELPLHVGPHARFATPWEHDQFLRELEGHCRRVAAELRPYAERWHERRDYPSGVTPADARKFVSHAARRLKDAVLSGRVADG